MKEKNESEKGKERSEAGSRIISKKKTEHT